jgi:hypothetical protein
MGNDRTTIWVSRETKQRLQERGEMGMTFNELLQDILDRIDELERERDEK